MSEDPVSDLPDLRGLSLGEVSDLDDEQIAPALARILSAIDHPTDAVAGFQSAI